MVEGQVQYFNGHAWPEGGTFCLQNFGILAEIHVTKVDFRSGGGNGPVVGHARGMIAQITSGKAVSAQ